VTHDQVLEQLRKLQTLAQRAAGTPEGQVARRKLRELMQRHGITAAEVNPRAKKAIQEGGSRSPAKKTSPTPATVTLKVGNVRIRWKL